MTSRRAPSVTLTSLSQLSSPVRWRLYLSHRLTGWGPSQRSGLKGRQVTSGAAVRCSWGQSEGSPLSLQLPSPLHLAAPPPALGLIRDFRADTAISQFIPVARGPQHKPVHHPPESAAPTQMPSQLSREAGPLLALVICRGGEKWEGLP